MCTASRDGNVKVWKLKHSNDQTIELALLNTVVPFCGQAVTTIDVTYNILNAHVNGIATQGHLVAIGCESGEIQIWLFHEEEASHVFVCLDSVAQFLRHGATVNKIKWKQEVINSDIISNGKLSFASAGDDNCVRIFSIEEL